MRGHTMKILMLHKNHLKFTQGDPTDKDYIFKVSSSK